MASKRSRPAGNGLRSLVYQLKVTLRGARPPIWRRLQLTGDVSLESLHQILQHVMGWENCHLWEFRVAGACYGIPHPDWGAEVEDAELVRLGEVVPAGSSRFLYVYDFGDDWEHDVVVEKSLPAGPGARYPVCTGGKRACPPEDCGGVWGYESLLEALRYPEDEENAELIEWVGDEFDPEAFSPDAVNLFLGRFRGRLPRSKAPAYQR